MKNIKMFLSAMVVCAMSYGSYTAYEAATMTEAERALIENVEALTSGETQGYNNAKKQYCTLPTGRQGCVSAIFRKCSADVFCSM